MRRRDSRICPGVPCACQCVVANRKDVEPTLARARKSRGKQIEPMPGERRRFDSPRDSCALEFRVSVVGSLSSSLLYFFRHAPDGMPHARFRRTQTAYKHGLRLSENGTESPTVTEIQTLVCFRSKGLYQHLSRQTSALKTRHSNNGGEVSRREVGEGIPRLTETVDDQHANVRARCHRLPAPRQGLNLPVTRPRRVPHPAQQPAQQLRASASRFRVAKVPAGHCPVHHSWALPRTCAFSTGEPSFSQKAAARVCIVSSGE